MAAMMEIVVGISTKNMYQYCIDIDITYIEYHIDIFNFVLFVFILITILLCKISLSFSITKKKKIKKQAYINCKYFDGSFIGFTLHLHLDLQNWNFNDCIV